MRKNLQNCGVIQFSNFFRVIIKKKKGKKKNIIVLNSRCSIYVVISVAQGN